MSTLDLVDRYYDEWPHLDLELAQELCEIAGFCDEFQNYQREIENSVNGILALVLRSLEYIEHEEELGFDRCEFESEPEGVNGCESNRIEDEINANLVEWFGGGPDDYDFGFHFNFSGCFPRSGGWGGAPDQRQASR